MRKVISYLEKKEKYIKLASFLLFIISAFIIGVHHEPWADEAQSWLIARDTNLRELFNIMAYEGSPVLWHIVLKLFIWCGLPYRYLFVVPLLFSVLGVWLLIYKSKLPLAVRILLPFTYFIFYQYTIVARSYCLVLPCIELIVLNYRDRLKKPYLYGLLLILLSSICAHTLLLSGVLFLLFCWDVLSAYRRRENEIRLAGNVVAAIIVGVSYVFTVWYLRTPSDCSFPAAKSSFNIVYAFVLFFGRIGETFIVDQTTILEVIAGYIFIAILALYYKMTFRFVITAFTVNTFLACFYCNKWHLGVIFLSFLLAFQLFPPKLKFTNIRIQKFLYLFIGFVLCVQISWSLQTSCYDYNEAYSGACAAAEFLKENNYDQTKIYGLGYYVTAIEPYFDRNIFKNRRDDKAYYFWSFSNGDMTSKEMLDDLPQIVVYSEFEKYSMNNEINVFVDNGYKCFSFSGATYSKNSIYEPQTYYVLVKQ